MKAQLTVKKQSLSARLPEFDLLRGLAIIGVIIIHITNNLNLYAQHGTFNYYAFATIHLSQRFCVPAFLIISGFFLTYKVNNEQNPTLVLRKRLSRIIPPYIIWSLIFDFWYIVSGQKQFNLLSLLIDLLTGSALGPYYFMILIIQCYLLWWVIAKLRLANYPLMLYVSAIIQLVFTVYFYLITFNYADEIPFMDRFVFCWSFYFIFGLFLGKNYSTVQRIVQRRKTTFIAITILSLFFSLIEFNFIYTFDVINGAIVSLEVNWNRLSAAVSYWKISALFYEVGFSLLVISLYKHSKINFLISGLADFSFPIYLIHYPILTYSFFRIGNFFGLGTLASTLILFIIDLSLSYAFVYISCKILPKKYIRYVFGL